MGNLIVTFSCIFISSIHIHFLDEWSFKRCCLKGVFVPIGGKFTFEFCRAFMFYLA